MSAFGNYEQDGIVDEVRDFIVDRKRSRPEEKISEIMKDLFDAINYGIVEGFELIELENSKES